MRLLNFRIEGRESFGALGPKGVVDLGVRLRGTGVGRGEGNIVSALRAGLRIWTSSSA